MALNYLLHRHQVSLMQAAAAADRIEVRRTHEAFAAAYACRINGLSTSMGGSTAPLLDA